MKRESQSGLRRNRESQEREAAVTIQTVIYRDSQWGETPSIRLRFHRITRNGGFGGYLGITIHTVLSLSISKYIIIIIIH